MYWIVIIENDGNVPPTQYYKDREKLAVKVRGNKEIQSMERRYNGKGVIIQEGCFIAASHSLAYAVARLAHMHIVSKYPHATVSVGTCEIKPFDPNDDASERVFNHLNKKLRRRGRKPSPKTMTVTCLECLAAHREQAPEVINCPFCGSINIKVRNGEPEIVRPPKSDEDLAWYWMATRFGHGYYEPPIIFENGSEPKFRKPPLQDGSNISKVLESPLMDFIKSIDIEPKRKVRMMDAAFVSRSYASKEAREELRSRVCAKLMECFDVEYNIIHGLRYERGVDIVDCATSIGVQEVVRMVKKWM